MEDKGVKKREMNSQKLLAVGTLIASLVLSILFFEYKEFFRGTASLGLFGIFVINFISSATFFVSGPAFLTIFAGGSIYYSWHVALVGSLGSAFGDCLGYVFGFSGRKLIEEKLAKNKWYKLIHSYFHRYGGWILLGFAFIPNPFFDSIGIIAGVFRYPLWKYFVIVLVGRFIRYYMLARFGALF